MSDWVECYGDKAKTKERFACRKCEKIVEASHKHGPPNGICTCGCQQMTFSSDAYRRGYDLIKWDRDAKEEEEQHRT